jgi:alpha-ribazole phosphatase
MTLLMVRHAPVLVHGICYGRSDVAVSPVQDAWSELSPRLARAVGVDSVHVYTSPSGRCAKLAQRVAHELRAPCTADDRLLELDFGEWEGRRWDDLASDDGARFGEWMTTWRSGRPPGGEALYELEERVASFLTACMARDHVRSVCITHAGVMRAVRVLLDACDWQVALAEHVPHLLPWIVGHPSSVFAGCATRDSTL